MRHNVVQISLKSKEESHLSYEYMLCIKRRVLRFEETLERLKGIKGILLGVY